MQLARYAEIPWTSKTETGGEQKPKTLHKPMFEGTPGQPDDFEMVVSDYHAPKYYPRHRHEIDQLRLTLRGISPWAPGMETPVGSLVYIPAGTYYGPYERPGGVELLAVQFEGANQTSFGDSGSPIGINPSAFTWRDVGTGAQVKELGTFAELGTRLAMVSVDAGSSHMVSAAGQVTLLFVTAGAGTADGEPIVERDGIKLEASDQVRLVANARLEVFLLGLPKLARTPAPVATHELAAARREVRFGRA